MSYYDVFTTTTTHNYTMPAMKPDPLEAKRKRCKNPNAAQSPEDFVVGRRFTVNNVHNPLHQVVGVEDDMVRYSKVLPNGLLDTYVFQDRMLVLIFNDGVSII